MTSKGALGLIHHVVYADILLSVNFVMNFALLKSTNTILFLHTNNKRIILSAIVGSIYALCMFFPKFSFFECFLLKILFAVSMTTMAFGYKSIKALVKNTSILLLLSFAYAGIIFAFSKLDNEKIYQSNGIFYIDVPLWAVILFAVIGYIAINSAVRVLSHSVKVGKSEITADIYFNDRVCTIKAMLDSGNLLKNISGECSVVICDYNAVKKLFDESDKHEFESGNMEMSFPVLYLSYKTLGASDKTIPYFYADKAVYHTKEGDMEVVHVPIAISQKPISDDNMVNALINPDAIYEKRTEAIK